MKYIFFAAAFVCFFASGISAQFQAVDSAGNTIEITVIVQIDAEKLTFSQGGEEKTISLEELSGIRASEPPKFEFPSGTILVELCDGSKVLASKYASEGRKAIFTRLGGEAAEIPLDLIDSVRFALETREEVDRPNTQWNKLLQGKKPNGDRLIVKTYDYFDGLIEDIDGETVKFNLEGEKLPVKISKIAGLLYHRSGDAPQGAPIACYMKEASGAKLNLSKISIADGSISWETAAGLNGKTPFGQLLELDFSSKNFVSLLDLEPVSYERAPIASWMQEGTVNAHVLEMLDKFSKPRIEKGLLEDEIDVLPENPVGVRVRPGLRTGPPQKDIPQIRGIVLDGKRYGSGVSLQAKSSISYNLDLPYVQLRGTAGIDDRLRPNGRVRLRIYGDERSLFETEISGDAASKHFQVGLEGVRSLKIEVEFIDGFTAGAQLELVELKLAKP